MLQHHAIAMQPYDGNDAGTLLAASARVERYPPAESDFLFQHLSGAIAAKRTDPTVILTVWAPRHENYLRLFNALRDQEMMDWE